MKRFYSATAEKATALRSELAVSGVKGARVRVMPNGAMRVVLRSAADRDAARDAFVMTGACTASGDSFTASINRTAWNGACEIFLRFLEA